MKPVRRSVALVDERAAAIPLLPFYNVL